MVVKELRPLRTMSHVDGAAFPRGGKEPTAGTALMKLTEAEAGVGAWKAQKAVEAAAEANAGPGATEAAAAGAGAAVAAREAFKVAAAAAAVAGAGPATGRKALKVVQAQALESQAAALRAEAAAEAAAAEAEVAKAHLQLMDETLNKIVDGDDCEAAL